MSESTRRRTVRTPGRAGVGLALGLVAASWAAPLSAQVDRDRPMPPEAGPVLTLAETVRMALDRSREVRQARLALDEAEERVSEAWGNVYPSVDLSATYTRNVSPAVNFLPASIFDRSAPADELIAVQFGADNTWSSDVSIDQPLFQAAAFIGVGAAGRFRSLQEEVLRGSTQQVVTSVRITYLNLLLAQEQERLTENSVRRVRETLKETRALNEAGLTSDYDVLRLEVELANLEPNLRRARNQVAQARRELGVVLDLEDPDALQVAGNLAEIDLDEPTENAPGNRQILAFAAVDFVPGAPVDRLVETAWEARSDLRQLELTESLRKTEMRLEQVEYLPRISLFGNYTINAQQNGDPEFFGAPRAYGRRVGVQVTVPIFQGFQRDARIDQKRAVLRSAEAQTRLARDRATSQVKNLTDQAEEAYLRAEGQGLAVTQARRGFDIARAQYREGLGSQLELTDAEVALRQSEFNYAQAVYDYLVARAQLDEAVGRVPLVDSRAMAMGEAGGGTEG